ncbi:MULTISPECIES: hypothetical protein [Myxococcaceae]|uniref:Uncharacterized protein n=3 Tax=Myxococcaceae TaxID=31 RepID=A0AAE6G6B6_MYXXA|nr:MULTISPECIES: hypothetical protein [Myxococcaceae]NVJ04097.1 hypothetical protein [Myxococcus sp. AM001]AEI64276.1 hypothetical protein LILAB_11835 [Corallococcus macrosporus]ATB50963.1 hypothetical protein MYMAC_006620 [Corallococcus macrosporus DSM 14697]NOK05739.1 hypothetical protein [Myxococcus xanthus]QDE71732.1 hypothetical protein BHS09_34730 [Myxococcus xanthus]
MRFKKLGSDDVGESTSRRHMNPDTGEDEINISDQDLAATPPLEEEPDFRDILPDEIHEFRRGDEEEEPLELTAQPGYRIRPIDFDKLPQG